MKATHPITALCRALEVLPSGYYDWEQRKVSPPARVLEEQKLRVDIAQIHQDSRQTYGAPRVQMKLRAQGHRHGRNRIGRLILSFVQSGQLEQAVVEIRIQLSCVLEVWRGIGQLLLHRQRVRQPQLGIGQ